MHLRYIHSWLYIVLTMKNFCLVLLAAGASACAVPKVLATGDYVETRGPRIILFESKELQLNPDQTFTYVQYNDDLSSAKHGTGKYELTNSKLRLTFTAQPPTVPEVQAQVYPLAVHPDSLILTFWVKSQQNARVCALSGATIIVQSAPGQASRGTATDIAGRATLRLARVAQPQNVVISNIGFISCQLTALSSAAYEVELPLNLGTPYGAGMVKEFQLLRQTDRQLVLRQGKKRITLLRQPTPLE